jgi:hypothetical protein
MKKTVLGAAVLMALGSGVAQAAATNTTNNNFTMISAAGGLQGGNNDTAFTWDGTTRTAVVTDGTSNATLSSVSKFSGFLWTAKNVNVYASGTYTFDTTCAPGNPACNAIPAAASYTLTVPAGYLGGHMLFDWGAANTTTSCGVANCNIDVIQLWKVNASWDGTGPASDPFCGELGATTNPATCRANVNNGNTRTTVWSLVSVDTPANVISPSYVGTGEETNLYHGTKMIDGPFIGSSANFNVQAVPVPAAVWLMGSGLLGLVGVARRKKKVA